MVDEEKAPEPGRRRMVVVKDMVGYKYWDEKTRSYEKVYVHRNEVHDFPEEEIARYDRIAETSADPHERGRPHVLPPDEYEAWTNQVQQSAEPAYDLTNDQIAALSSEDLIARMNMIDGFAERVLDLEEGRPKPRRRIINHAQRVIDAHRGDNVSLAEAEPAAPLTPSQA